MAIVEVNPHASSTATDAPSAPSAAPDLFRPFGAVVRAAKLVVALCDEVYHLTFEDDPIHGPIPDALVRWSDYLDIDRPCWPPEPGDILAVQPTVAVVGGVARPGRRGEPRPPPASDPQSTTIHDDTTRPRRSPHHPGEVGGASVVLGRPGRYVLLGRIREGRRRPSRPANQLLITADLAERGGGIAPQL